MHNLFILIILICLSITTKLSAQDFDSEVKEKFYKDLNRERRNRLLPKLRISPALEKESEDWIKTMNGKLRHSSCNRKKGEKYRGEILADCTYSFDCWMNSEPHRKIMLNRKFRKIGFAVVDRIACARFTD